VLHVRERVKSLTLHRFFGVVDFISQCVPFSLNVSFERE
jgi:hypothetical protein